MSKDKYNNNNNTVDNKYNLLNLIVAIFAVTIAGIAAFYSCRQTEIAENIAQKQLRAYIGIDITGWGLHNNQQLRLDYRIVNFGQTPAKKVLVRGEIKYLPINLSQNYIPEYYPRMSPEQSWVIFPNETSNANIGSIYSDKILTPEEIGKIQSVDSKLRGYSFISITYTDIFDIERHFYFCAFLDPKTIQKNSFGEIHGKWIPIHLFNNFD